VEHRVCSLSDTFSQGQERILQQLLGRVDDDLLRIGGDARHPWCVLVADVLLDELQHVLQQLIHVVAGDHADVGTLGRIQVIGSLRPPEGQVGTEQG